MKISILEISGNYSFLISKNNLKPGYMRCENVKDVDFVHMRIAISINTTVWLINKKAGGYFCSRDGNVVYA